MTTTPSEFPRWTTTELIVPCGEAIEYKFIIQRNDGQGRVCWEDMKENRILDIVEGAASVTAHSVWNDSRSSTVTCPTPKGGATSPEQAAALLPQAPTRTYSIDERAAAITPKVFSARTDLARIKALTTELSATDKLLVERNNYCRKVELDLSAARHKLAEQEIESAAKEARLLEAAAALKMAERENAEKSGQLDELERQVAELDHKNAKLVELQRRATELDTKNAKLEELQQRVTELEAQPVELMAQVQKHEATIANLQRQCIDKDAEIRKLQKKDMAAKKDKRTVRAEAEWAIENLGQECLNKAHANHGWKSCHPVRAR